MRPAAPHVPRRAPDRALLPAVCAAVVLAGCAVGPPAPAPPAPIDAAGTVNAARSGGCAASRQISPLRTDPRLDAVAARLPSGEKLADAVSAERYPAARSSSIRVSRVAGSDALYQLLTKRFCSSVADPAFEKIGIARQGDDLWIVLAAPFAPPAVGDAGAVARRALTLVNEARSQARRCGSRTLAAAPPVALDATLMSVATAHARDMPNRAPVVAAATMSPMSTKPPIAVRIPSVTPKSFFTRSIVMLDERCEGLRDVVE